MWTLELSLQYRSCAGDLHTASEYLVIGICYIYCHESEINRQNKTWEIKYK